MVANVGQTIAAGLLIGAAVIYLLIAFRRWLKGQSICQSCCSRGTCSSANQQGKKPSRNGSNPTIIPLSQLARSGEQLRQGQTSTNRNPASNHE